MAGSGALTVGVVGAIIAAAVITVLVLPPMYDDDSDSRQPVPAVTSDGPPSAQPTPKPSSQDAAPSYGDQYNAPTRGDMSLVEVFEKAEPSVVRINVQRSPDIEIDDGGVGSGFVYDTSGHIITNAHVIRASESISVTFLDGRTYEASIAGVDKFTDVAVLSVSAGDASILRPLTFGDSSGLKVGEPVASIGNPFGLSGSMTAGIVSQVGRLLPSSSGYSIPDIIQTDAAINPGNSGGPLLNMRGEVVGVSNAIQSTSGEFAGVGFAIPSQTILKIAPVLIAEGEYAHPWIGISGRDVDPETARLMGLDEAVGFLVVDVIPGSPADEAGLRQSEDTVIMRGTEAKIGGDVILEVDGNEVRKIDDILVHLQRSKSVGDATTVQVLRDGQTLYLELTLQQRPE